VAFLKKNLSLLPQDTSPETYQAESSRAYKKVLDGKPLEGDGVASDKKAKLNMHLKTASSAAEFLETDATSISLADFLAKSEDSLLLHLDSLSESLINANDYSIFAKLTRRFERRFFEDVNDLNVLYRDAVTRITEFGKETVGIVVKMVDNGFTSDGSVYFDIANFEDVVNHCARPGPWNRNDNDQQKDGEGALSEKTPAKQASRRFEIAELLTDAVACSITSMPFQKAKQK
jgi:cysteinyl-tRNA synthetase